MELYAAIAPQRAPHSVLPDLGRKWYFCVGGGEGVRGDLNRSHPIVQECCGPHSRLVAQRFHFVELDSVPHAQVILVEEKPHERPVPAREVFIAGVWLCFGI